MIGIILLSHDVLHRTATLARHFASQGCKVVIHVDLNANHAEFVSLQEGIRGEDGIILCDRHRCEWGSFSLVEASCTAAGKMLKTWPEVSHICQLSGSCLPVRPVAELQAHLASHPDTDFIESVSAEKDNWVLGGLSSERFTLYFPFSWRRQRKRFDATVTLQRKLGVNRRMPSGLRPFIGSQWWCLSARTLRNILNDPGLSEINSYFKRTWIPDESYFQTLVQKHSQRIVSEPLTFVRFDPHGKPFIFYDDHLDLLLKVDSYFARKIWHGADLLYDTLLSKRLSKIQPKKRQSQPLEKAMRRAANILRSGRPGLINQNRYSMIEDSFLTARSYYVFDGIERLFPKFVSKLEDDHGIEMHGHLFEPDRIDFKNGQKQFAGNLTDNPKARDYRPQQFLVNLIWGRREIPQGFLMKMDRMGQMNTYVLRDSNAQLVHIKDIWLLDAMARISKRPELLTPLFTLLQAQAHRIETVLSEGKARNSNQLILTSAEIAYRNIIDHSEVKADVLVFSIADFFLRPVSVRRKLELIMPPATDISVGLTDPQLPAGFGEFLDQIEDAGFVVEGADALRELLDRPKVDPKLRILSI